MKSPAARAVLAFSLKKLRANPTCQAWVGGSGAVSPKLFLGEKRGHFNCKDLRPPYGRKAWMEAILAADAAYQVSRAWQAETMRPAADLEAGLPADLSAREQGERRAVFRQERARLRKPSHQPKQGHGIATGSFKDPSVPMTMRLRPIQIAQSTRRMLLAIAKPGNRRRSRRRTFSAAAKYLISNRK